MEILDLRKEFHNLYNPSPKNIVLIEIPEFLFIMVDGAIEPGMSPGISPGFQENTQALYGAAYSLKFAFKQRKENPVDYPVMALEGLWWVDDGIFDINKPGNWKYTLMIMIPNFVTREIFTECTNKLIKKKGNLAFIERLRMATFKEGLVVQTMHIGPYSTEPTTMERMKIYLEENHLIDQVGLGGKHHEIYLGDPRRGDPEKIKTVLRHPVSRKI